jgi:uncharacterized membrane protein
MIAVLGGLGAAAAWALATVCSSRSSRLIDPYSVTAWVMLVGLLVAGPAAVLHGVPAGLDGSPGRWLVLAGAGNVAGLLLLYGAMRIGQVSLVAPLVSIEGAIAAGLAIAAGETLAPAIGGTLLVIAVGVCLAAMPATDPLRIRGVAHPRSVLLALSAACALGVGLYATGRAGSALPVTWVALSARVFGTVVLAVPLALAGRLRLTRGAVPFVAVSGVCEVLGFYAYASGARHGIAVAAVLSSQYAALAVLAAYFLFGERLTRVQLVGVSTVLVGVALLSALRA